MTDTSDFGNAICTNCGAKLNPGAKFCNTCGQKVLSVASALKCPKCGKPLNENSKFCRHCGAEIKPAIKEAGTPAAIEPAAKDEKKKDNSKILIGVMACVIVLLAVIIAFLLGKGSAAKPTDQIVNQTASDVSENTETSNETINHLDLTYTLDDIEEMKRILPTDVGYETEDYANWWYSANDNYAYARRTHSSQADYFYSTFVGHSIYGITIGEPLNVSGLTDWDQIDSNYHSMTYRLENMVLSISFDPEQTGSPVTELEFDREYSDETSSSKEDDSYFFPDSLDVLLDESQLYGMSARELTLARNEIYARYGYTFQREDLQEYFNTKSWYHADPSVNKETIASYVSAIGMKNMVMIREYQKANGLTY